MQCEILLKGIRHCRSSVLTEVAEESQKREKERDFCINFCQTNPKISFMGFYAKSGDQKGHACDIRMQIVAPAQQGAASVDINIAVVLSKPGASLQRFLVHCLLIYHLVRASWNCHHQRQHKSSRENRIRERRPKTQLFDVSILFN